MITVMSWERAVHYRRGQLVGVLEPGRYRHWGSTHRHVRVDMRSLTIAVAPQDIATSDALTVKVTAGLVVRVVDPVAYVEQTVNAYETVYDAAKAALRTIVRARTFEEIAAGIPVEEVPAEVRDAARAVGYEVETFSVRDVIPPADVRRAAEELVTARQRALVALEEARGQSAVLRHLANVAGVLEDHPALASLRLAEVAGAHGGSIVIERPTSS
jgi:regulator of protease activity HflC (stomatin/prohibitin superfamily)